MLRKIEEKTLDFQKRISKELRKEKGQFFTGREIAEHMSSLIENISTEKEIQIADCGAGTGILGFSLIEELKKRNYLGKIKLDFYENDKEVLEVLKENKEIYLIKNSNIEINIIEENFILFYENEWKNRKYEGKYNIIIGNPPYKKLPKSSVESEIMEEIVHGQPNMYFLFMAMSIHLLKENGEMIYIVPRSFTSGAYFKKFREFFLKKMSITNLHIFEIRDKIFKGEKVLQETLIIKAIKKIQQSEIQITSSQGVNFDCLEKMLVKKDEMIGRTKEKFILIPTTISDIKLLKDFSQLNETLLSLNLKLKTGKVVDFRVKEYLTDNQTMIPLIWADNFKKFLIEKKNDLKKKRYLIESEKIKKSIIINKDYLFVKRFTSKEEEKRIQIAIYDRTIFDKSEYIGIENHVNYIETDSEMITKEILYGLFVFFNSTYVDRYYRILNGNTQVNATEFNEIPICNLELIKVMGKEILENNSLETEYCDIILNKLKIFKSGD